MNLAKVTVIVNGEKEEEKTQYSVPVSFLKDLSDDALGLMIRMTLDEHAKRYPTDPP